MDAQTVKKIFFTFLIDLGIIVSMILLYKAFISSIYPIFSSLAQLSTLLEAQSEVSVLVMKSFKSQIDKYTGIFYILLSLIIAFLVSLPGIRWIQYKIILKKTRKIIPFYLYSIIIFVTVILFSLLINLSSKIPFLVLLLFIILILSLNTINLIRIKSFKKTSQNIEKIILPLFLITIIQLISYFVILLLSSISIIIFLIALPLTNTLLRLLFVKLLANPIS
ncbi:MAG TPA: hypothetical protein PLX15_03840 [Candidatus Woesearchaeota archaeon]|nr:hypothetical protein [Candidatus Woesearchaeota archaeon]